MKDTEVLEDATEKQMTVIKQMYRKLLVCLLEEAGIKDKHDLAKKQTIAAQNTLNDYIKNLDQPIFPQLEDGPEDWRSVTLAELGITGKAAIILAENDLGTLGYIADWQKEHSSFYELPGIGEATAEKLAEKLDAYWQAHPQAGAGAGEAESETLD